MRTFAIVLLFVALAAAGKPTFPKSFLGHLKRSDQVKPENRIIDGDFTPAHIAPYAVSMSPSEIAYTHVCAGTLIAKDWILTAAHCLDFFKQLNTELMGLPVFAGIHELSNTRNGQTRYVDYAASHKGYNGEIGSDDIALLHVSEPFEFNEFVQQAVLPSFREESSGRNSSTYGWGIEEAEGTFVTELRAGKARILSSADCSSILPPEAAVTGRQVCARSNACYGDGGSPLVVEKPNANAELFGITSWGYLPCGYSQRPTVYTAVAHYIDWIAAVQWNYYYLVANA